MAVKQKTILHPVSLSGIGLHTGCEAKVTLKPAASDAGIRFIRTDLSGQPSVVVHPDKVKYDANVSRCTSLMIGEQPIHTVEHLMSALCGLGISNITVEIDAPEPPGLDGSSQGYVDLLRQAGIAEQEADADIFDIREPIGVERNGSSIYIVPSPEFRVSYALDYQHPHLTSQFFEISVTEESYAQDIAPCRTFCLEREIKAIQQMGLGKGAGEHNALVFGDNGVIGNTLRFANEPARHKILDCIGDLYLLGAPIRGHVYAVKSGHNLNIELLKKIQKQRETYSQSRATVKLDDRGYRVYDLADIMRILPHRYPFLLVDRVYEVEPGKRGIGIKNFTMNEQFFQGHFPTRPVVPGVLTIEAMAQSAGVIALTNPQHAGKLAFFMTVDQAKFRRVVVPGDQLVMDVEIVKDRSRTIQARGVGKVGHEVVVEADMVCTFMNSSYLFG